MSHNHKIAKVFAAAVFAASSLSAAHAAEDRSINNWMDPYGLVWMNGDNKLCWQDGFWTPATAANAQCGLPVVAKAEPAPPPPPPPAPAPAPEAPKPAPAPVPVSEKVTYSADTFFQFNKAVLLPAGKEALDQLADKIKGINLEVVISTGYTDSFGSVPYNLKLSLRRAEAVKAYLVSKGIPADKIYVEGKGKTDFRVDPKSCKGTFKQQVECQAPNRRTVVEVVGTHMVTK
jgi:OOP family OmpA-OmpF porin